MRNYTFLCSIAAVLVAFSSAFAPIPARFAVQSHTQINMGFGLGDEEPKVLTRENEPEDFFSTDMDKMTDAEKLPVAIAGFAFISLPFLAGMIALYAAK